MSIEELLQQMEKYRTRREQTDHRPQWLREFIHAAAEVFEPLQFSGRIGFDCRADESGWLVSLYMGTTEIIGGPRDGQIDHVSFRIDVMEVSRLFDSVSRMEFYSVTNESDDRFQEATRSLLTVSGSVKDGGSVRLELLGCPPKFVGPGLKKQSSD